MFLWKVKRVTARTAQIASDIGLSLRASVLKVKNKEKRVGESKNWAGLRWRG